jgi:hypothetical protein
MKQTKFITLLLCNFFILHLAQAQTAALSFVNPTIVGNKLQVTLRMASVGGNFGLGASNFRLNYATSDLSNPIVLSENFTSPSFDATTTLGTNTSTGIVSINTAYLAATNSNILPITAAGVDLVTLQFNILNGNATTTLSWRTTASPFTALLDDDKTTNRAVSTATSLSTGLAHPANAGDDVTINCANPTAALYASGGTGIYTWSTGATTAGITVNPATTTTYSVTATNGQTDQVTVFVSKSVNAGADVTTNCTTPTATLTATCGTGGFLWSTGETTAAISVNPTTTTTYSVTTTNGTSDQVIVFVDKTLPTANAGADVTITCLTTANLTAIGTGTGLTYKWTTNQTTAAINVNPSVTTTYTVTVTAANGCKATDQVMVTTNKTLPTVNAGADETINCLAPAAKTLTATASSGVTYLWSNGATLASINVSPTLTTSYNVTVTNSSNGCKASDLVVVNYICTGSTTQVNAKVLLNSVIRSTKTMDSYLRTLANFPLSDPYTNNQSFAHVNNFNTMTIQPSVLAVTGNNSIVDWVFVELRTGASGATTVQATRAALLQSDGDIVDADGVSPITFPSTPAGNYYITIRHRNHLSISSGIQSLSSASPAVNFTNVAMTNAVERYPGIFTMRGGDANVDGSLDSTDSAQWEVENGNLDDYTKNGDFNLDGSVDAFDSVIWNLGTGAYEDLP